MSLPLSSDAPVLQQHLSVIRHFDAGFRESEADVSLAHEPHTFPPVPILRTASTCTQARIASSS